MAGRRTREQRSASITGEEAPWLAADRALAQWDQFDREQTWGELLELGAALVAHRADEASPTWTSLPQRYNDAIAKLVTVLRHDGDLAAVAVINPRTVLSIALVRGLESLVDEHRTALEAVGGGV